MLWLPAGIAPQMRWLPAGNALQMLWLPAGNASQTLGAARMQCIRNAVAVCTQRDKDEDSDTCQVWNLIMQAPITLAVVMQKATAFVHAAAAKWHV